MPCKEFISIRLEPGKDSRVYVDKVGAVPFQSIGNLTKFTLRSATGTHSNKGTMLSVEALRWPPPEYDASTIMALNAQWPIGQKFYETNDTAGHTKGRSFSAVEFTYDASAKKLSWTQKGAAKSGKATGSVEFNATTPVWGIVLALDPAAKETRGELIIDGADITKTK